MRRARGALPLRRNAAHLLALSAFAIAQPLFAKLGPAPGYFAAHHLGRGGVVAFALAVLLVPPLVLLLLELVLPRLHIVFVAGLIALIALPPLAGLPTALAYGSAAALGIAAALAYARTDWARRFASALALGPVLFLVAFLGFSSAGQVALGIDEPWEAEGSYRPQIVFIQLDALSSLMLETPERTIDAKRFPTFARLAREGVWYRNASNVHENTVFSVSAVLDGQTPSKGTKPVVQDHPQNLFTLLAPSYEMNVAEEATTLCPYEFCGEGAGERDTGRIRWLWDDTRVVFNHIVRPEDERDTLPSLAGRWSDFGEERTETRFETRKKTPQFVIRHLRSGRIGRFERWLDGVGSAGVRAGLNYVHVFLPHEPREFLPDGRRYPIPDGALESPPSYDKQFLAGQGQQRLILQTQFTDRLIGRVIERLEERGIYDDALFVVVSDHGESFDVKPEPAGPFVPGRLGYRRAVTPDNIEDIASVPLFVKYPRGRGPTGIDDRFVRSVDVLPTISRLLQLRTAPMAGSDLRDPAYRGHDQVEIATTFEGVLRMPVAEWQKRREASLRARLAQFGSGDDSLYRWGPRPELVGKRPDVAPVGRVIRFTVDDSEALRSVDPLRGCPCLLAGQVIGSPPQPIDIAVVVNGRIQATARTFPPVGRKRLAWAALVPPAAFRRGRNEVEVLALP